MKPRRLAGAGAAGVAVVLLTAPIAAPARSAPAQPVPADVASADPEPAEAEVAEAVVALDEESAVAIEIGAATTTTTTSTVPPRPTAACPVAGPVQFIDSFGHQRAGHRHAGVDMMAAEGTPAVAPVAGMVTHRTNRTGGLSYHLDGVDGSYYYGTHLSAYGTAGWVEAGDVIGFVGGTGNARGNPHLHFEIHPGGEGTAAIDPYDTVSFLCPGSAQV